MRAVVRGGAAEGVTSGDMEDDGIGGGMADVLRREVRHSVPVVVGVDDLAPNAACFTDRAGYFQADGVGDGRAEIGRGVAVCEPGGDGGENIPTVECRADGGQMVFGAVQVIGGRGSGAGSGSH